ncbi:hypothetical protein [Arthrobacter sp. M4]|uniref:hypothetical protein n=1 Tax=Arthrobacter sp. M4 TaxID=218160 RepID=UPI001CDBEB89|nr:hypothetical protein [Arthrobacter sp. M4]MCA4134612.1 hypothetical protein [Arthrobacter sp. M4]
MQPCTPASHPASNIHHNGGRAAAFGDEPDKHRPGIRLTASDAGTHRLVPAIEQSSHYLPASVIQFALDRLPADSSDQGSKAHGYRPQTRSIPF